MSAAWPQAVWTPLLSAYSADMHAGGASGFLRPAHVDWAATLRSSRL